MTFDSNTFLKKTLISGLNNGSFRPDQVSIFSFNYLQRGLMTQDTFDEINQAISDYKAKQAEIAKVEAVAEAKAKTQAEADARH